MSMILGNSLISSLSYSMERSGMLHEAFKLLTCHSLPKSTEKRMIMTFPIVASAVENQTLKACSLWQTLVPSLCFGHILFLFLWAFGFNRARMNGNLASAWSRKRKREWLLLQHEQQLNLPKSICSGHRENTLLDLFLAKEVKRPNLSPTTPTSRAGRYLRQPQPQLGKEWINYSLPHFDQILNQLPMRNSSSWHLCHMFPPIFQAFWRVWIMLIGWFTQFCHHLLYV